MPSRMTVGDYLLCRLQELKVGHVFGVPGDYNLGFLDRLARHSDLRWVGTRTELNAAYAADGYARVRGLGALLTTYGVGELSALNGVAGAYAEQVPVVAITGAPSLASQRAGRLLHHTLGTGDFAVFGRRDEAVTAAHAYLTEANAVREIDRVLASGLQAQRPVYLQLPADVVDREIGAPAMPLRVPEEASDPEALREAVDAVVTLLNRAERPVLLPGFGIERHGLHDEVRRLLAATAYPFAALAMDKGLLEESHPQFLGLYLGTLRDDGVRQRVEAADAVLLIGALLTDFNTGGFSARLEPGRRIEVQPRETRVGRAVFAHVAMRDLLRAITPRLRRRAVAAERGAAPLGSAPRPGAPRVAVPITQAAFWDRMAAFLRENDLVLAEAGSAMFGILGVPLPNRVKLLSQPFWASVGYAMGACLGASLAAPGRRTVLFVGDGSFQCAAPELSTMLQHGLAPVIFVLNNGGYSIERTLRSPLQYYHGIPAWDYARLPDVLGLGGWGVRVRTTGELETALATVAREWRLALIEVMLEPLDVPDTARRFGEAAVRMEAGVR